MYHPGPIHKYVILFCSKAKVFLIVFFGKITELISHQKYMESFYVLMVLFNVMIYHLYIVPCVCETKFMVSTAVCAEAITGLQFSKLQPPEIQGSLIPYSIEMLVRYRNKRE